MLLFSMVCRMEATEEPEILSYETPTMLHLRITASSYSIRKEPPL